VTTKRVEDVWSASDHPWSAWTKRPLFSSLSIESVEQADESDAYRSESAPWSPTNIASLADECHGVIIDLPGADAVASALALSHHGFRPILSINATSAPDEVIDMRAVLDLLAEAARFPSSFPSGPQARFAFILDSRRDGPQEPFAPGLFDNRWTLFPSDLPSAKHFENANIERVVIVQEGTEMKDDLAAIAWEYRRGGVEVCVADPADDSRAPWTLEPPSWLSSVAGRLRRRFQFRRRWDGSYGHRIPIPPEPSHG
jgi:hypothetical protein